MTADKQADLRVTHLQTRCGSRRLRCGRSPTAGAASTAPCAAAAACAATRSGRSTSTYVTDCTHQTGVPRSKSRRASVRGTCCHASQHHRQSMQWAEAAGCKVHSGQDAQQTCTPHTLQQIPPAKDAVQHGRRVQLALPGGISNAIRRQLLPIVHPIHRPHRVRQRHPQRRFRCIQLRLAGPGSADKYNIRSCRCHPPGHCA